jgi:preprotein translocase subunit SecD
MENAARSVAALTQVVSSGLEIQIKATSVSIATNSSPSGANATIVIRLAFTAAKADQFRKFTREHMNQQTQLVVGAKTVAEPFISAEISDGHADMVFSAFDEARAVRDLLTKKSRRRG